MISTGENGPGFQKVLLVSLHYHPEPNFITADLARYLVNRKHDVTVLTAHPSYPLGKFYEPKGSAWPRRTIEDGVKVWRLPVIPDHSNSKYMRAAYYISFLVSAFIASLCCGRKDLVIVYHTPFTTALSVVWRRLFCTRLIYISPDLWPESFPASGIRLPHWLYQAMHLYSKTINRFATHIITSTKGIRDRYINDGIAKEKVSFYPVWVDGLPDRALDGSLEPSSEIFEIVYAGNLGPAQSLDTLLKAAVILRENKDIKFSIYGTGAAEAFLKEFAATLNLKNVTFRGRVSPDEAFEKLNQASAVLLHLRKTPLFSMTIPSKLASLLASNSLLLCGAEGETSQIVHDHAAGLVFEAENAQSLADTILKAQAMPCNNRETYISNAHRLYNERFSKKVLLAHYYQILVSK